MDRLTLLGEARAAGLNVAVKGDTLVIRGPRRAEPIVRKLIDHKPELMAALAQAARLHPVAHDPVTWRDFYEERAAISEFEGGLSRHQADAIAFEACLVE